MRRLIVNADDFGLSAGVNAGVVRAHREGIVTSASLMVRQPAAAAAAQAARSCPRLSLGLHVDLEEWERLEGEWVRRYSWVDSSDVNAVADEVERQVVRFRELVGRDPTHLDSHQHVHREEPVRSLLVAVARRLGVALRDHSPARFCGAFYGRGRDGTPLPEAIAPSALARLLRTLPDGTTELCCHPGEDEPAPMYGAERRVELASLCDANVVREVADAGIRLIGFAEL